MSDPMKCNNCKETWTVQVWKPGKTNNEPCPFCHKIGFVFCTKT